MKYPDDIWKQITNANCVETALQLGLDLDEKKSDKKAIKVKGFGGLFLWRDGSGYYHHSNNERGNAVHLVQKILGVDYKPALDYIYQNVLGKSSYTLDYEIYKNRDDEKENKNFSLPEKTKPKRIYAYLIQKRGIDKRIISSLIKSKQIFEEKDRGNVCFVGYDKNKNPKYCAKRGTSDKQFRGETANSNKSYGFFIEGKSDILKVFESPIDAISHANLAFITNGNWQKDTRLSLGGCSDKALEQHLKDYPNKYKTIWFCLDNDKAGVEAATLLANKYMNNFNVIKKTAIGKDWNEDLQQIRDLENQFNCTSLQACAYLYKQIPIPSIEHMEEELQLCE